VDRDGTVYRLMPENWMARHCIGLNHVAIGVEMLATAKISVDRGSGKSRRGAGPLSCRQVSHHAFDSAIKEYRQMEEHPYFLELDPNIATPSPTLERSSWPRCARCGQFEAARAACGEKP